jgi:hypothetical protein
MTKEVKLGRIETNITRLATKSYRVRVGKNNKCVNTRAAARNLKKEWLNK